MSFPRTLRITAAGLALACAGSARAHAILVSPPAAAGSFYKAVIGIPHGCNGTATTGLIVEIPPGVANAKPMPKPGWTIAIERAPLAQPRVSHGRTITDDVVRIRYTGGKLPSEWYDEFSIVATMPEQTAPLYWKVSQLCEQGHEEWDQILAPGQSSADLKHPALRLDLTPATHAGHEH